MTVKVVAIVQARMGSSRLPGKVLLDLSGEPMLARVTSRVKRARLVHEVVVATTTDPADDLIAEFCEKHHIPCHRGSQFDVLDRYYRAAASAGASVIVRITADCPVIDPVLIDQVVDLLENGEGEALRSGAPAGNTGLSFAANRLPPPWRRTYPIGLDVEACTFEALETAWREATAPQEREHVMPYLYEGVDLKQARAGLKLGMTPRGFLVGLLDCEMDLGRQRWTVDTPEDLTFMRSIFELLGGVDDFSWKDVLEVVNQNPELVRINAGIQHKALTDVDKRAPDRKPR